MRPLVQPSLGRKGSGLEREFGRLGPRSTQPYLILTFSLPKGTEKGLRREGLLCQVGVGDAVDLHFPAEGLTGLESDEILPGVKTVGEP